MVDETEPKSAAKTERLLKLGGITLPASAFDEGELLMIEAGVQAERQLSVVWTGCAMPNEAAARQAVADALAIFQPRAIARDGAKLELNDRDNSTRFLLRYPEEFIFVRGRGLHRWCGTHYEFNGAEDQALVLAGSVASAMHDEARFLKWGEPEEAQKRQERRHAFACTSGNLTRLRNMVDGMKARRSIDVNDLDANPHRVTARNGTLEFKRARDIDGTDDGSWRAVFVGEHSPKHLASRRLEVDHVEGADCPRWRAFMAQMQPDEQIRVFLQKWAGLQLLGVTDHQAIVVHFGTGANGKSTYAATLGGLYGGYTASVKSESILSRNQRRGEGPAPDLVRLIGVRSVQVHEYPRSEVLDEALVKSLTGGEKIPVRALYADVIELEPRFKLEIYANDKPAISGASEGIWRRVHLVPWSIMIPEGERRRMSDMLAEFEAERSGILNWLIDGAVLYLEDGLTAPDTIREATQDYRDDSDPVRVFIRECVRQVPDNEVSAATMFDAYDRWREANAATQMKQRAFGHAMAAHGYRSAKRGGLYRYLDIRLSDVPLRTPSDPRNPNLGDRDE